MDIELKSCNKNNERVFEKQILGDVGDHKLPWKANIDNIKK